MLADVSLKDYHASLRKALAEFEKQHWGYDDEKAVRAFVAIALKQKRREIQELEHG